MKDIPVTVVPLLMNYVPQEKSTYFVNCPRCGTLDHEAKLEVVSKAWDLGYQCTECGLIFKTDYRGNNAPTI